VRDAPINPGRILIVDDEPAVRVVAARILESQGYTVDVAGSGRQGLDMFKARDGDFLCVLLDMSMPEMDGLEVRAELSALRPEVRVLIMSGFSEKSLTDLLAIGFQGLVVREPIPGDRPYFPGTLPGRWI